MSPESGPSVRSDIVKNNSATVAVSRQSAPFAKVAEAAESAQPVNANAQTDDILQGNVAQRASVKKLSAGNGEGGSFFWGLVGVALLALIAIYAVLDRKVENMSPGIKSEADLYKVIEIEDEN